MLQSAGLLEELPRGHRISTFETLVEGGVDLGETIVNGWQIAVAVEKPSERGQGAELLEAGCPLERRIDGGF